MENLFIVVGCKSVKRILLFQETLFLITNGDFLFKKQCCLMQNDPFMPRNAVSGFKMQNLQQETPPLTANSVFCTKKWRFLL